MATPVKVSRSARRGKHVRHTEKVLDRRGKPAPIVTAKDLQMRTGSVLRMAKRRGAVAISRAGRPVTVALAPDHFVMLCVAYATKAVRGLSL